MSSDAYASWIMSLHEHETKSKTRQQKFQKCLQVKNFVMKMRKEVKDNMQKVIKENQFEMLSIETKAATTCEWLRILRCILLQPFAYYKLDSNKRLWSNSQFNKTDFINTKSYILSSHWLRNEFAD